MNFKSKMVNSKYPKYFARIFVKFFGGSALKQFLGFAFINYSSFEAADAALEAMNGQYLCNRPITIRFVGHLRS